MHATDLRNLNFDALRDSLAERRADVYRAFLALGPATTATLAARCGIGLLSLRPRTTELEQLGLVECVGREQVGRTSHGVYRARDRAAWQHWHAANFPVDGQLQMGAFQP